MADRGLASRTIVLVVIMIIVLVIGAYLAITYFLSGKGILFSGTCSSYMLSQCSACVAGTAGGDCATEDILSCGCNECTIGYVGLEPARIKDCAAELRNAGFAIGDDGIFKTTECSKIGVNYREHPLGKCR